MPGILNNTEDASLVQAIIAMARSLRMTVIAEGVETGAQLDYLHHHGCDLVQGHFLSRPLAAREIGQLLDSGNLRDNPPTTAQMGLWAQ